MNPRVKGVLEVSVLLQCGDYDPGTAGQTCRR